MSRANRAHLNGDETTTLQALEQARSSALALSNPVPYLEITDNKIATALLKEQADKAAEYFQRTVDNLESSPSDSGSKQMIAQFQLVYAKNRLAFVKLDQGNKVVANKLFKQSLNTIIAITRSEGRDDVLPFRVEEFLALIGVIDSTDLAAVGQEKSRTAMFYRACKLEDSYIFDKSYLARFQKCAQNLREQELKENEETPEILPFALPSQSSQIESNVDLVQSYILQALSSGFRTRHDDANIVVTAIRLAEILRKLDRQPEARRILTQVARRTNRESFITSNVWRDLIKALDSQRLGLESIALLRQLVEHPEKTEKLDSFLEAELLFELGRHEILAGDRSDAVAHLTESERLFEARCYKIGAHSVSSASRKLKEVKAMLARARNSF